MPVPSGFISLSDIVDNFLVSYTGPGKIIPDAKRTEVVLHAKRDLQEFAFETAIYNTINTEQAIPLLAEEALYSCMVYSILSRRDDTPPATIQRLFIEKTNELEKAKSRLVFTPF